MLLHEYCSYIPTILIKVKYEGQHIVLNADCLLCIQPDSVLNDLLSFVSHWRVELFLDMNLAWHCNFRSAVYNAALGSCQLLGSLNCFCSVMSNFSALLDRPFMVSNLKLWFALYLDQLVLFVSVIWQDYCALLFCSSDQYIDPRSIVSYSSKCVG